MAEPNIANQGFSRIQDVQHDSKSFEGLVSAGIVPRGFRVIVGSVDLTGVPSGDEASVLDASGNQIYLPEGTHVLLASTVGTTAITGGATIQLGLAATAGDDVALSSDVLTAVGGANVSELQSTAPLLIADNRWLSVAVTTAGATTGVVQVTLVVV